ncbi:N-acetylmuramoyl-L-alanine amidase [Streptomyces sp. NPDC060053]|uniref:N-acetylmuramoyl-L-alanine amidase n=1 Tax=Streptomyces sp. NPDC060053 TaxID=3347047 RepID=UPI003696EDED
MATPLTAATVLAALRAEGVTVVEVGDWRNHNRAGHGAWGPVHGVVVHHTVTSGTAGSVAICRDGYAGLPGPLCHGVIDKQGVVHLVGWGRTNHAGSGDGDVLKAVIAERALPAPNENDTDGNARFYGFECVNLGDGKDPWPDAQLEAMVRAAAALCRAHGWSAASVIGHKEWTNTKTDPRGFTMADFRKRVTARLGKAPTPSTPPTGTTKPSVSLKQVVAAARQDPDAAQGHTTHKAAVLLVERALKAEGLLGAAYVDGSFGSKTIAAYARWQRSPAGGGYTGDAADGIPGKNSLRLLGARYGFDVKE